MFYNWEFATRARISEEERRQLVDTVLYLSEVAGEIRRSGLMDMEGRLDQLPHFLLRKGLGLILSGHSAAEIRHILQIQIIMGEYRGRDLLERCLIMETVLAVQQGAKPRAIIELLTAFLGEGYLIKDPAEKEFVDYLKHLKQEPETDNAATLLDSILETCDQNQLQTLLQNLDTPTLALALKRAKNRTLLQIYDSMSTKAGVLLWEEITDLGEAPEADVSRAHTSILAQMSQLEINRRS